MAAVSVIEQHAGEARLLVDQDVDLPAMITAAQHAGVLVSFAYEPPTLSELFRQAVAA
jgi:ABC-2 type transport system ATP-binding protein